MIDTLLAFLAPHLCFGCGQIGTLMCPSCKENIVSDISEHCIVCERQTGVYLCNNHADLIEQGWYIASRTGPLERLIDAYKFENAKAAYRPLAELLRARLPDLPKETVIVPIPTISRHIRQRGYDHVQLVARELGAQLGLRVRPCLRRATTTKQRDASRCQRELQAKQAFAVRDEVRPDVPYLIIDDIATTGATLRHAAQVLRDAGARRIWVAAIARQPLD